MKKEITNIFFIFVFFVFHSSLGNCQTTNIFDIQGNTYKTVKIGDQIWMAENLRVTQYSNKDEIKQITNDSEWATTNEGACCYYENKTENSSIYGTLYNWYTINDKRGICPLGWHVPSDLEWMTLETYLGMSTLEANLMTAWRGTNEGDMLKQQYFGGNNSTDFSAMGTGYRDPAGIFKAQSTDVDFWTSTGYFNNNITYGILHGLLKTKSTVVRNFHDPGYGFCVRCIQDKITQVPYVQANENNLVFPNLSGGMLNIRNVEGNAVIIMNMQGKILLKSSISGLNNKVDISGFESGVYILKIIGCEIFYTTKFIKD
jgi:uncharacterized protein (TIGR02145 family)